MSSGQTSFGTNLHVEIAQTAYTVVPREPPYLEISLLSHIVPREKFADEIRRRRKMGCMSTPLCPDRCGPMSFDGISLLVGEIALSLSLSFLLSIVFAIFVKRVVRSILEKER